MPPLPENQTEKLISSFCRKAFSKQSPLSLAELKISEAEYQDLCQWAKQLDHETLDYWFRPYQSFNIDDKKLSRPTAIGFILLLLASETVRREAKGRELWAVVRKKFSGSATSFLFVSAQPNQTFKDVIQNTTHEFNLRHVFGIEGLHHWFDSIYLQIGFTYFGLKTHLPEWLGGANRPLAVQYLLGEKDENLQSEQFKKLWDDLLDFRDEQITETILRQELAQSVWILPNWIDELISCVRKKLNSFDSIQLHNDYSEFLAVSLLRLRWQPPHPPEFILVPNLTKLEEDEYDVFLGHRLVDRLIRQEDGSYVKPEWVFKPFRSTENVILKNANGEVIESLLLQLWCHDEELNIFDLQTGLRIENSSILSINKNYALLVADDLSVEPQPSYWAKIADKKLYYLTKGWSQDTQISQLAWQATAVSSHIQPAWAETLQVSADPVNITLGEMITLQTSAAKDVKILSIRAGGKKLNLEESYHLQITPDVLSFDFSQQIAKVKL